MAMARGHSSLGRLSQCLFTHGIQTPKTKPAKSPPTRLTRSMYASQANPTATRSRPEWHLMHDEPPIPGPSTSSKPPEDVPTCEPEPEVSPMQSMGEPFGKSSVLFIYSYQPFLTPPLAISTSSRYSLLCNHNQQYTHWILHSPCVTPPSISTPVPSQCQAPLIPTMMLARNLPTYSRL
ncbi:hypothetical protein O181_035946 [Austropuccinia psidii MF-1]|uniref:Uncharacterized protein n=1 Tax=Austropuccinia psidii MF-1 TaxID=1389203 RepID=A0A9Q3D3I1_9BASI|nr:hypothetical protein [Austropuccinia psidii MF-1]